MTRLGARILWTAVLLWAIGGPVRPAAALQMVPAPELEEAHALRQRILVELPQVEPGRLRERPRFSPETLGRLQQQLAALRGREEENPFFQWAEGELLRQAQGPAAAEAAFERAAQAAGDRFLVHWLLWQDFLERDLSDEAGRAEGRLQALQMRWGQTRFPLLARELIRQATEAREAGEPARAVALYDRAVANAPELPEALIGRAAATWHASKLRVAQAGWDLVHGLFSSLRDGSTRYRLTGNLLLSLQVTWLAVFGLVVAVLAFKAYPLFAHDLSERFLTHLPPAARGSLCLLLLLLPLLLGLGLLWTAAFAALLSVPYLTRRERLAVSGLILLLAVLPLGYQRVAAGHLLAASPRLALLQAAEQGGRGEGLAEGLRRWTGEAPDSGLAAYALGLVLKRRGELAEAEAAMARAARLLPQAGFVQVGVGNLQFLQGRGAEAEAAYLRAAELQPSSAAAQFNLAQVYAQRMQLDQYDAALARSLRQDARMVQTLLQFSTQGMTGVVVDGTVPWPVVAADLSPPAEAVGAVAEGLWGTPLRGVPLARLPLAAGALLALFWIPALLRGRRPGARRCQECGTISCPRCQPNPREKGFCDACAALHQREGVAAFIKARRLRESEDWQRRERMRASLLGSLLPGGKDLYTGRIVAGLLLCMPAVWVLLEGLLLNTLTPSFRLVSPLPDPVRWLGALLLLLVLYALSLHRSWRWWASRRQ